MVSLGSLPCWFPGSSILRRFEPFYSWFYCFAWWSYILAIERIDLLSQREFSHPQANQEFLLLIPWSVFIWLIFEAANLSLKNWYYITLPVSTLERWLGYAVAYGTVLPGIFETTELLETFWVVQAFQIEKVVHSELPLISFS